METYFAPEARERLIAIFPEDGNARFDRLNRFVDLAAKNPNVPLIVPPDVDAALHEVLAARPPLERLPAQVSTSRLQHVLHLVHIADFSRKADEVEELSPSLGKKFQDLTGTLVERTREIFAANNFEAGDGIYEQPACSFTLAAA